MMQNPEINSGLPIGWHMTDDHKLCRAYMFSSFADALLFANMVGEVAESIQHHPELKIEWGRCTVVTWTHDAGQVTEKDINLALQINQKYT